MTQEPQQQQQHQRQQQLLQVPPEASFQTTNGLHWVLKCHGKALKHLASGPAEIPVYSQLGCGQFGRVFEVLPCAAPSPSAAATAAHVAADRDTSAAAAAAGEECFLAAAAHAAAAAAAGPRPRGKRAPPPLPPGQQYAAKLLLLYNFETQGTTADLVREFSLYGELETPGNEGLGFANVLRVYGVTSCVHFSKPFAEVYLSGVQTAGILVVERCVSDLAAFTRLLHAQGKLNHSALKFYAWQLLNGVARLHDRGVIHRDLKPENILISAPPIPGGSQLLKEGVGILKIADLGMARKVRSVLGREPAGTCASSLPVRDELQPHQQSQQQQQQQQQQGRGASTGPQDWRLLSMRQSGRVVTLPYRPPEILSAAANNRSAAKLPVATYSSSCDIWSLGVILLELCLPQKAPWPYRWNFAFILHAVGRGAFQMEFMVLENILKVLGRPKEQEQLLDMTKLAGDQRADLLSFVQAFPSLTHSERKMALLDFIAERGGLHLDALGLDLLARLLHVSPSRRLSAHCALSHPWFHDLPFDNMNRLGLSFHLADLEISALRASLPSPLRRCLTAWEARGRCPSSTRFACHALLQQALLQQQQQQQQQRQQQRLRCSSSTVLPLAGGPHHAKGLGGAQSAAAAHDRQQQQQQQQLLKQHGPLCSRRSGDNSRLSGSSGSVQKLRTSSSTHCCLNVSAAAAASQQQQQQLLLQHSSSVGGPLLASRPGSVTSSGPSAALQRSSNSSLNRRSDSVSRELKRKGSEGGPGGAPGAKGPQGPSLPPIGRRQREQKQRSLQHRQRGLPVRTDLRRRQQCAGSDDEVVRSPWRCTRPAAVSASTSVLPSLPLHPSLSHRGPLGPGGCPVGAPSATAAIAAAAAATAAGRGLTSSPRKCQKTATSLECRSGDSTPYHDALPDDSCSPAAVDAAAASAAAVSAGGYSNNENVDSLQASAALGCSANSSCTRAKRRGVQGAPARRGPS